MFSKNDCMQILVRLGDEGLDINKYLRQLIVSKEAPIEVLKFISKNRGLDISNFYDMLRKKHNEKKSPLYTNIMNELEDGNEVLITLSSLLTQVFLHCKHIENPARFLKEIRANEIAKVINAYCIDENPELCIKMLQAIRSDLTVMEYISGRRDLA
jgi:hypothetical protein